MEWKAGWMEAGRDECSDRKVISCQGNELRFTQSAVKAVTYYVHLIENNVQ